MRKATCDGKKNYRSKNEAERIRKLAANRKKSFNEAHVYFCRECKAYHLGNKTWEHAALEGEWIY